MAHFKKDGESMDGDMFWRCLIRGGLITVACLGMYKMVSKSMEPPQPPVVQAPIMQCLGGEVFMEEMGKPFSIDDTPPEPEEIKPPTMLDKVVSALAVAIVRLESIMEQATKSGDSQTLSVCHSLLQRLREVKNRLGESNRDLIRELAEIGSVQSILESLRPEKND